VWHSSGRIFFAIPVLYIATTPTSYPKLRGIMTEKTGHFEKGVWVEEPAVPEKNPETKIDPIDLRLAAATRQVLTALDDLATATHDLVTTEEGKKHIEKTVKDTTTQVQKSFDEILARAKVGMDKVVEPKK
jgi:hypothetical protein